MMETGIAFLHLWLSHSGASGRGFRLSGRFLARVQLDLLHVRAGTAQTEHCFLRWMPYLCFCHYQTLG
jgi:hypothetical protein